MDSTRGEPITDDMDGTKGESNTDDTDSTKGEPITDDMDGTNEENITDDAGGKNAGTDAGDESETKTNGKMVALDAGHQLHGDNGTEPVGPGSSTKKAKVSSGTTGVATGVPEYQLNLTVAKKLKKELRKRGYKVFMVRDTNDVSISNVERAQLANDSGADIYIRIHADGVDNSSASGASALYPSRENPYVGNLSDASKKLSETVLKYYCNRTGLTNRGLSVRDDLTGTNWSRIPVTLIEMGFMSNASEDRQMQESSFQKRMVQGMADGVDAYFGIIP